MSLGENIVKLRTEKGWTQDDLAERIGVSRQSISKWETDASVPELEKLLRLGIFAMIFLTMLGGLGTGLLFGVPLLGCSIICLAAKKRAGLWCGWFMYGIIHFASLYMTGITWKAVFSSWFMFRVDGNPLRVIMAWVYFAFMLVMITATLISYRNLELPCTKKNQRGLIIGWTILALLVIIPFIVARTKGYNTFYLKILERGFQNTNYPYILLSFATQVLDAVKLIMFVVLAVRTRAFQRGKKIIK